VKIEAAQRLIASKQLRRRVLSDTNGPIFHSIYITLKDRSEEAIQHQLELGKKYLSGHPGELSFVPCVMAKNVTRHKQVSYLVNEDFDVAFHFLFKDRESHDKYQTSERHVKHFIPESNTNWVRIKVFDSVRG
jgi:hypothetical protein